MSDVTLSQGRVPPVPPTTPSQEKFWKTAIRFVCEHGLLGLGMIWSLMMSFLPKGITTKRVITRMAWITVLMFATYNVLGLSYYNVAKSWGNYVAAGFPTLTAEQWSRMGAFAAWGLVSAFIYYWIVIHHRCMGRGMGFFGYLLRRILPIIIVGVLMYNPYFSYMTVGREWVIEPLFPNTPWYRPWTHMSWNDWQFQIFVVITILELITWSYILKKAWQGLGNSKMSVVLMTALIGSLLLLLKSTGYFPTTVDGITTLVQLFAGPGLGFAFSMTYVDRELTGTMASTTIIKESDQTLPTEDQTAVAALAEHDAAAQQAQVDQDAGHVSHR